MRFLPLVLLALSAFSSLAAAADSPTPFALAGPLTDAQMKASSPFFTIDGKTRPILATPPAQLEDLQILKLWPGDAPLQNGSDPAIDIPTLTVFLPPTGKATGSVVVVFPGGGYSHLAPKEVLPAVQWLASNGITAFVLKYRLGMKYHHPAEMDDGQRSIRYVRANAASWGLDPKRVGLLGFSAGGHLASTMATHFDAGDPHSADPIERMSSRPDLHILLYAVMNLDDDAILHKPSLQYLLGDTPAPELRELLSNEKHVTADTPPAFVVHSTGDTTVPVVNSDRYVAALEKNNVQFVYIRGPFGRHGFGLTDQWSGEALAWLRKLGF